MSTINPNDIITLTPKQLEVYKIVLNELGMINVKWGEFQFLYSTSAYQSVLSEVAPTFFGLHQQSQMRDVLQSLCRIHDRPTMRLDENFSLLWLAENLTAGTVKTALDNVLTVVRPKLTNIRTWRNKMGSHNDYSHITSFVPGTPLFHLSEIDEVIKLTNDAFNIVAAHDSRQLGTYPFDIPVIKGAETLVHFLEEQIQANRKKNTT